MPTNVPRTAAVQVNNISLLFKKTQKHQIIACKQLQKLIISSKFIKKSGKGLVFLGALRHYNSKLVRY